MFKSQRAGYNRIVRHRGGEREKRKHGRLKLAESNNSTFEEKYSYGGKGHRIEKYISYHFLSTLTGCISPPASSSTLQKQEKGRSKQRKRKKKRRYDMI